MQEPLKKGDLAEVIDGALGPRGPNIGKTVTVGVSMGEHSQYGRIVRCHGSMLISEYGVITDNLDFAVCWLRKIENPNAISDVVTSEDSHDSTAA